MIPVLPCDQILQDMDADKEPLHAELSDSVSQPSVSNENAMTSTQLREEIHSPTTLNCTSGAVMADMLCSSRSPVAKDSHSKIRPMMLEKTNVTVINIPNEEASAYDHKLEKSNVALAGMSRSESETQRAVNFLVHSMTAGEERKEVSDSRREKESNISMKEVQEGRSGVPEQGGVLANQCSVRDGPAGTAGDMYTDGQVSPNTDLIYTLEDEQINTSKGPLSSEIVPEGCEEEGLLSETSIPNDKLRNRSEDLKETVDDVLSSQNIDKKSPSNCVKRPSQISQQISSPCDVSISDSDMKSDCVLTQSETSFRDIAEDSEQRTSCEKEPYALHQCEDDDNESEIDISKSMYLCEKTGVLVECVYQDSSVQKKSCKKVEKSYQKQLFDGEGSGHRLHSKENEPHLTSEPHQPLLDSGDYGQCVDDKQSEYRHTFDQNQKQPVANGEEFPYATGYRKPLPNEIMSGDTNIREGYQSQPVGLSAGPHPIKSNEEADKMLCADFAEGMLCHAPIGGSCDMRSVEQVQPIMQQSLAVDSKVNSETGMQFLCQRSPLHSTLNLSGIGKFKRYAKGKKKRGKRKRGRPKLSAAGKSSEDVSDSNFTCPRIKSELCQKLKARKDAVKMKPSADVENSPLDQSDDNQKILQSGMKLRTRKSISYNLLNAEWTENAGENVSPKAKKFRYSEDGSFRNMYTSPCDINNSVMSMHENQVSLHHMCQQDPTINGGPTTDLPSQDARQSTATAENGLAPRTPLFESMETFLKEAVSRPATPPKVQTPPSGGSGGSSKSSKKTRMYRCKLCGEKMSCFSDMYVHMKWHRKQYPGKEVKSEDKSVVSPESDRVKAEAIEFTNREMFEFLPPDEEMEDTKTGLQTPQVGDSTNVDCPSASTSVAEKSNHFNDLAVSDESFKPKVSNLKNNHPDFRVAVEEFAAKGPFKVHCCRYCDYKTRSRPHMMRHIHSKRHRGIVRIVTGQVSSVLEVHDSQTLIKPFVCGYCSLTYRHFNNCLTHQRKKHPDKPYNVTIDEEEMKKYKAFQIEALLKRKGSKSESLAHHRDPGQSAIKDEPSIHQENPQTINNNASLKENECDMLAQIELFEEDHKKGIRRSTGDPTRLSLEDAPKPVVLLHNVSCPAPNNAPKHHNSSSSCVKNDSDEEKGSSSESIQPCDNVSTILSTAAKKARISSAMNAQQMGEEEIENFSSFLDFLENDQHNCPSRPAYAGQNHVTVSHPNSTIRTEGIAESSKSSSDKASPWQHQDTVQSSSKLHMQNMPIEKDQYSVQETDPNLKRLLSEGSSDDKRAMDYGSSAFYSVNSSVVHHKDGSSSKAVELLRTTREVLDSSIHDPDHDKCMALKQTDSKHYDSLENSLAMLTNASTKSDKDNSIVDYSMTGVQQSENMNYPALNGQFMSVPVMSSFPIRPVPYEYPLKMDLDYSAGQSMSKGGNAFPPAVNNDNRPSSEPLMPFHEIASTIVNSQHSSMGSYTGHTFERLQPSYSYDSQRMYLTNEEKPNQAYNKATSGNYEQIVLPESLINEKDREKSQFTNFDVRGDTVGKSSHHLFTVNPPSKLNVENRGHYEGQEGMSAVTMDAGPTEELGMHQICHTNPASTQRSEININMPVDQMREVKHSDTLAMIDTVNTDMNHQAGTTNKGAVNESGEGQGQSLGRCDGHNNEEAMDCSGCDDMPMNRGPALSGAVDQGYNTCSGYSGAFNVRPRSAGAVYISSGPIPNAVHQNISSSNGDNSVNNNELSSLGRDADQMTTASSEDSVRSFKENSQTMRESVSSESIPGQSAEHDAGMWQAPSSVQSGPAFSMSSQVSVSHSTTAEKPRPTPANAMLGNTHATVSDAEKNQQKARANMLRRRSMDSLSSPPFLSGPSFSGNNSVNYAMNQPSFTPPSSADSNYNNKLDRMSRAMATSFPSPDTNMQSPLIGGASNDTDSEMPVSSMMHCAHCGIYFMDPTMFVIHRGTHGHDNPLECNICGKVSKNKFDFMSHFITGH